MDAPPRAVRIARPAAGRRVLRVPRGPAPGRIDPGSGTGEGGRRANRGGTQRALRLTFLFVGAVAVLFGAVGAYAGSAQGGSSPGAGQGLALLAGVGALVALVGALLTVGSAPRAVVFTAEATTVIGRFGRRRRFAALPELAVHRLEEHPPGWLSPVAVETVEIVDGPRRARLLVEAGWFSVTVPPEGT